MYFNNFDLYKIECKTNMHVGEGNSYGSIVDNRVQRDVVTGFPIINSSSLKGSLRCFLSNKLQDSNSGNILNHIFGSEKRVGGYKIFPGMLLAIPLRSNERPYYLTTCNGIIKDLLDFINNMGKSIEWLNELQKKFNNDKNKINIEGEEVNAILVEDDKVKSFFGEELAIIDDSKFNDLIKYLPIIARNKLDNGESKNLWYEEVVPRKTLFYFGVVKDDLTKSDKFDEITEYMVQIGGNATIGYGCCKIEKVEFEGSEKDE